MSGFVQYLPYLFPFFFASLWISILWIFSLISGWTKLAEKYRHRDEFQGQLIRFQSARMNWVQFKNNLNLGLTERGLYLAPMVLFRPFLPPLFIPWEQIVAEPMKRVLFRGYQLRFRAVPGVRLTLYQSTFQRILDFLEEYPDRLRLDEGRAINW